MEVREQAFSRGWDVEENYDDYEDDDDDSDDDEIWERLLRAASEPLAASERGFISEDTARLLESIPPHELDLLIPVVADQKIAGAARRQGIKEATARQRYARIAQRPEKEAALRDALLLERVAKRAKWRKARDAEAKRQQSLHAKPASKSHSAPSREECVALLKEDLAYWRKHERIAKENSAPGASSLEEAIYWEHELRQARRHIAEITEQLPNRET